jgi:archaellum biogenesis protein FlaJ (TadC family)
MSFMITGVRPASPKRSRAPDRSQLSESAENHNSRKEERMSLLLALVILLVLFGVIGGLAITKFLFFVLIAAALLALIGFFARGTA